MQRKTHEGGAVRTPGSRRRQRGTPVNASNGGETLLPLVEYPQAPETVEAAGLPEGLVATEDKLAYKEGEAEGLTFRIQELEATVSDRDRTISRLNAEIEALRRDGTIGGVQFAALKAAAILHLFPRGASQLRAEELRQAVIQAPADLRKELLSATIWLIREAFEQELLNVFPEAARID